MLGSPEMCLAVMWRQAADSMVSGTRGSPRIRIIISFVRCRSAVITRLAVCC